MINIDNLQILGKGIDGTVYSLNNNTFIKIVKCNKIDYFNIRNNINWFIVEKPDHYVNIYHIDIYSSLNDNFKYYYTGEILNNLSEDEFKLFHSILSHEDNNKIKNLNINYLYNIIKVLNEYLEFDFNKVLDFINKINNCKIKHLDMHPRNIMKDSFGNFKFIDLERVVL